MYLKQDEKSKTRVIPQRSHHLLPVESLQKISSGHHIHSEKEGTLSLTVQQSFIAIPVFEKILLINITLMNF